MRRKHASGAHAAVRAPAGGSGPDAGILLVALNVDYGALSNSSEQNLALWQAHYFRKAVSPVLLMQGIQALLFAGGLLNYATAAANLARRIPLPPRRRVIDAAGVGTGQTGGTKGGAER